MLLPAHRANIPKTQQYSDSKILDLPHEAEKITSFLIIKVTLLDHGAPLQYGPKSGRDISFANFFVFFLIMHFCLRKKPSDDVNWLQSWCTQVQDNDAEPFSRERFSSAYSTSSGPSAGFHRCDKAPSEPRAKSPHAFSGCSCTWISFRNKNIRFSGRFLSITRGCPGGSFWGGWSDALCNGGLPPCKRKHIEKKNKN